MDNAIELDIEDDDEDIDDGFNIKGIFEINGSSI